MSATDLERAAITKVMNAMPAFQLAFEEGCDLCPEAMIGIMAMIRATYDAAIIRQERQAKSARDAGTQADKQPKNDNAFSAAPMKRKPVKATKSQFALVVYAYLYFSANGGRKEDIFNLFKKFGLDVNDKNAFDTRLARLNTGENSVHVSWEKHQKDALISLTAEGRSYFEQVLRGGAPALIGAEALSQFLIELNNHFPKILPLREKLIAEAR